MLSYFFKLFWTFVPSQRKPSPCGKVSRLRVNLSKADLEACGKEVCVVERGEILGTAATIDVEDGRIIPTSQNLSHKPKYFHCRFNPFKKPSRRVRALSLLANSRYYEPFEVNSVIFAGRATTCLYIKEQKPDGTEITKYGTASFFDECHLITAGHNVMTDYGGSQQISMTNAGSHIVDFKNASTQRCTLLENLYKHDDTGFDIAILKVDGHNANAFLTPEYNRQLSKDDVVDIVGYPGRLNEPWERLHKKVKNIDMGRAAARKMLPFQTLTVTRGSVERISKGVVHSKISTCPGMSGGVLMSNGVAYGYLPEIHIIYGIHLGKGQKRNENSAILFNHPVVRRLLRTHVGGTALYDSVNA